MTVLIKSEKVLNTITIIIVVIPNKTQDLIIISTHSRTFIMYLNGACDDLYQKIVQKLKL